MFSDLRFVCRTLARARGFTAVTVLTLALGIGAAAAIFSVADWVLFRSNRFPADVHLIGMQFGTQQFNPQQFEFATRAYEAEKNILAVTAKAMGRSGNVVVEGRPVSTGWEAMSASVFSLLEIRPRIGRTFRPEEEMEGKDDVVVVSDTFWKKHLGASPDVLNRKLIVGETVCTIVGVLPAGRQFPLMLDAEVYRPLTYRPNPEQPWALQFTTLVRLAPGVTATQAQAALRAMKVETPESMRSWWEQTQVVVNPLSSLNQFFRPEIYWLMLGAVGFLYAIACLNAANLMLVRVLGLRRELSIRLALGGGAWRIARLLFLESAVLALLGGLLGLIVANWLFPLLLSAIGNSTLQRESWATWTLDWRVVGVMGGLTLLTSGLIALIPVWQVLRSSIGSSLKEGGAAVGEGRGLVRLRGTIVVLQAAFAVILLSGAGLMIRTFSEFQKVDLGFDPAGVTKISIGLPPIYPKPEDTERCLQHLRAIQGELARLPGVRAVGFGQDLLLPGYYYTNLSWTGPDGRELKAQMLGFNIGYQAAAGIHLKRGRWLQQSMGNEVLVNEALARQFWPGQDPIGRFLKPPQANAKDPAWQGWEVVGVVGDIRSSMREQPGPCIYTPEGWGASNLTTFVVKFAREPDPMLADSVRRRLYAFDPRLVVNQAMSVSEFRQLLLWAERMASSVFQVLAGIALVLTVVGVFSVLAYTVDRRMGEFGVRMALGATRRDLVALVAGRGLALTLGGVLLGLGGAVALGRFLQSLLFETRTYDPAVLLAVACTLLGAATLACVLPARRAARVDISKLLRAE